MDAKNAPQGVTIRRDFTVIGGEQLGDELVRQAERLLHLGRVLFGRREIGLEPGALTKVRSVSTRSRSVTSPPGCVARQFSTKPRVICREIGLSRRGLVSTTKSLVTVLLPERRQPNRKPEIGLPSA